MGYYRIYINGRWVKFYGITLEEAKRILAESKR